MPQFRTVRRVKHTPEKMFALVADVEKYPEFLPLCTGLVVRKRSTVADKQVLIADMSVGYKAIRETFTSRVTLDETALKVLAEYIDGPFSVMENRWSFKPDGQGCSVEFYINYEFKNRLLGLLMGSMFDTAFRKFSEAFERRADKIYGKS